MNAHDFGVKTRQGRPISRIDLGVYERRHLTSESYAVCFRGIKVWKSESTGSGPVQKASYWNYDHKKTRGKIFFL